MERASERLRLWNQKLTEVIILAGELQQDDRKLAEELWHMAEQHIQALWDKNTPTPVRKNMLGLVKQEEETNTSSSSRPASKKSVSKSQTLTKVSRRKAVKEEPKDADNAEEMEGLRREHLRSKKKSSSVIIKQEEPLEPEISMVDETQEAAEVQSVHLMISAEPVKAPSMSRFKKVSKNENTGKVETTYHCEHCPKQYRTALAFYKHLSSHDKDLECPICHQKMCNRHALNAHKRTHTGDRPYECPKCSSKFTTRGNLARHIATHEGKKPWQCSLCGKRYSEKKSLKVHMRTHTGEKPYACQVCSKRFSQSGVLQAHMLIHSNQYEHLCDICGRSFRQRSQLATHHLRHQGVRPFSCPSCERSFTTKGDMERHLKTHTGERPFSCDVCGSSFARPQTLQEHKNRHYNFKPYKCKICDKSFHEMAACSRHVKGLHAREKGDAPASAFIVRLTNPAQQDEAGKQNILITHVRGKEDIQPSTPQGVSEGNDEEEEEEEEEEEMVGVNEKDGEEGKHHIFVMHTTEPEETQLITIAEHSNAANDGQSNSEVSCEDCITLISSASVLRSHARRCTAVMCEDCRTLVSSLEVVRNHMRHCKNHQGLSMAECLFQDSAMTQDSTRSRSSNDGGEEVGVCSDGEGCEVVTSDLEHPTVTISEDVTITSLPLTQLPPIHLQLESDYMVVLREPSSGDQASARTLPQQQVDEAGGETSQPRLALVSTLLNQ